MNPKFSITIPTYNRAKHIKKTINTILKQSFQNFEIIVVDDGSTDNTNEIIENAYKTNLKLHITKKKTPNVQRLETLVRKKRKVNMYFGLILMISCMKII